MESNRRIAFFHAPNTRSSGVRALLEEIGADYELHVLDMKSGEHRQPAYLALNPMGKVPAVRHGETVVTEQGAVYLYLADLHPETGLAPAIGDSQRGAFLRWLFFHGSAFEPALIDRHMKQEPPPRGMSPYGDYDTMLATLVSQLEKGPYMLGERFSAADVLWGSALGWTTRFKLVPDLPVIQAYVDRIAARPAVARARELDAALAAQLTESAKG